jgi:hypothetical protein
MLRSTIFNEFCVAGWFAQAFNGEIKKKSQYTPGKER